MRADREPFPENRNNMKRCGPIYLQFPYLLHDPADFAEFVRASVTICSKNIRNRYSRILEIIINRLTIKGICIKICQLKVNRLTCLRETHNKKGAVRFESERRL